MQVEDFPKECRRIRSARRPRTQYPNNFSPSPSVGDNIVKYRLPFAVIQHVHAMKKKGLAAEECSKLSNPSSQFSCFPSGPRSKAKTSCKQIEMQNHIPGEGVSLSVEGDLKELYPCSTSTKARPHKGRKRKTNPNDKPSDSKAIVPRRVHFRGRAKRGRTTNTSPVANERGKLDSATFIRYFMHLWSALPEEKLESVAYFDPLWFELYASKKHRPKVLNWIKGKRVFSQKYVFVPIVIWSHWSLLIFCHLGETPHSKANGPCMLLLDSLHSIGPTRLEPLIRSLLFDMYKSEEITTSKQELKKTPLLIPKVPQQKKGDECGFYILYFIKLFLESAPENLNISEGYPHFMKKDWFTAEQVESFCTSLDAFPLVSSDHGDLGESDSSTSVEFVESSFFGERA